MLQVLVETMKVKQFNAAKWLVEVPGVGAVFVGKKDQCHEYIEIAMRRETRFRYENITQREDFYSFQRS